MSDVRTLAQMEGRYPDEWVLILDPEIGPDLLVRGGVVAGHSPDRDELYRQASALRPRRCAVSFMGDPIPPRHLACLSSEFQGAV